MRVQHTCPPSLYLFCIDTRKVTFNADSCHSPFAFAHVIKQALLFIAQLRAYSPVSRCEYTWVNDKLIWYREPIIHALRESIAVINVETFLPSRLRHRERRSPRDRCYLIIFVSFNRHPIVTDAYIMSFVNATSVQRWVGNARERTIGSSWARRDSRSSSWRSRSIRA